MPKELYGIYQHFDLLDPAVYREQRMAELRNLAEFRQRHLKEIVEWSDPEKRAAKKAKYAEEEGKARELLPDIPAEHVAVRTGSRILPSRIVFKFLEPKLSWWRRFLNWITRKDLL